MTLLMQLCNWSFKGMMRSTILRLLCICTIMLAGFSPPAVAQIILSADQDSAAVREFSDALARLLPERSVAYMPRATLQTQQQFDADTQLILLGPALLDWRLQLTQNAPATLILQVSRVQAHHRLVNTQPARLTFMWSDPAPERQVALLKAMLPGVKNVGVLYGNHSAFLLEQLTQVLKAEQLTLKKHYWPDSFDARSLSNLLSQTDVLLGLDDTHIYNSNTIKSILLSSYARKQVLIGPSAAFIRAGSLASTYSDQDDWLHSLQDILQTPEQSWPASLYPTHYKVISNAQVARSLGIPKASNKKLTQQLQRNLGQP